MAVVSHINRQGGSRSRTLNRHACRLLLWSQDKFLSLRAVHVLGVLNLTADFLLRQKLRSGEWMLNHQTVVQIWDLFGKAEVDLFASQDSFQSPLWFSLSSPEPLGIDALAHPWPERRLYVFLPVKLIPAVLCRVKESGVCLLLVAVLAIPDVVLGADSSSISAPLGDSDQAGPALSASGQDLAPSIQNLEAVSMAHPRPQGLISSLPANARAPATRKLYSSKWRVFEFWGLAHAVDPVNCPIGPVLEFLQERLEAGASATTLSVYVAAIADRRELDEMPLGWHQIVSAFMHGVWEQYAPLEFLPGTCQQSLRV